MIVHTSTSEFSHFYRELKKVYENVIFYSDSKEYYNADSVAYILDIAPGICYGTECRSMMLFVKF